MKLLRDMLVGAAGGLAVLGAIITYLRYLEMI